MKPHTLLILLLMMAMAAASCGGKVKRDDSTEQEYSIFNENLITANKYLVKEDAERTAQYIKRRSWKMTDGDGGIQYMVCAHGNGDSISTSPNIQMDYRVELLDGTICYDSEKDGKKELTVGASEMEPGMTRTFRRLCHGDSAVLILPPHFAKGLIGDMDRIPPHSVVVYFVRIND
ncbi:MAG: FKBP-type peptidyl-prolyl cis-trans isomerase [Bacteroidales bacterium]|nr:FKBP-type peptidyl-prolyl cis-trans isomerase [Bacteroidales bacterium]MBR2199872.1 FKBP-type peptidyl-prolyl cis-trans isomerase [Bacteroidales bacterium]MBR4274229.1 FKBP-type peptidyl-prolyl cis-trans isomerase [Bacteroidales bacterium]